MELLAVIVGLEHLKNINSEVQFIQILNMWWIDRKNGYSNKSL